MGALIEGRAKIICCQSGYGCEIKRGAKIGLRVWSLNNERMELYPLRQGGVWMEHVWKQSGH